MSQIDLVVQNTRKIESLLETVLSASGRGLHEKLSSVEVFFTPAEVRKIRYIATMRNNVLHKDGFKLKDEADFQKSCTEIINLIESKKVHLSQKASGGLNFFDRFDLAAQELFETICYWIFRALRLIIVFGFIFYVLYELKH